VQVLPRICFNLRPNDKCTTFDARDRAQEEKCWQEQQQPHSSSYAPSSSHARAVNAERRLRNLEQLEISLPGEDLMHSYKGIAAAAT